MSADSSNTENADTPAAEPKRHHKPWGIIGGALIAFVAMYAPIYLLAPLLEQIFPLLPVSVNIKLSIADALVYLLGFLCIFMAVLAYGQKLRDIGFTKLRLKFFGVAAIAFVAYFILTVAFAAAAHYLLPFVNQNQSQDIGYSGLNGLELFAAFIPLVLITPVVEETIFRGFMFAGFRRHLPFWIAAIGVSALFGVAHGQWNVGIDVFTMSMVSCYLRETTNSLWPSIFLHVLKNGVAFYLLYLYNGH